MVSRKKTLLKRGFSFHTLAMSGGDVLSLSSFLLLTNHQSSCHLLSMNYESELITRKYYSCNWSSRPAHQPLQAFTPS